MQYQLFLISDPPSYRETVMTEKRVKTLGSQRAQVSYMGWLAMTLILLQTFILN